MGAGNDEDKQIVASSNNNNALATAHAIQLTAEQKSLFDAIAASNTLWVRLMLGSAFAHNTALINERYTAIGFQQKEQGKASLKTAIASIKEKLKSIDLTIPAQRIALQQTIEKALRTAAQSLLALETKKYDITSSTYAMIPGMSSASLIFITELYKFSLKINQKSTAEQIEQFLNAYEKNLDNGFENPESKISATFAADWESEQETSWASSIDIGSDTIPMGFKMGDSPTQTLKKILKNPIPIHFEDPDTGESILYKLVTQKDPTPDDIELATELALNGARLFSLTNNNDTAAHYIVREKVKAFYPLLFKMWAAGLQIEDINVTAGDNTQTVLHEIMRNQITDLLVDAIAAGANLYTYNNAQETPAGIAYLNKYKAGINAIEFVNNIGLQKNPIAQSNQGALVVYNDTQNKTAIWIKSVEGAVAKINQDFIVDPDFSKQWAYFLNKDASAQLKSYIQLMNNALYQAKQSNMFALVSTVIESILAQSQTMQAIGIGELRLALATEKARCPTVTKVPATPTQTRKDLAKVKAQAALANEQAKLFAEQQQQQQQLLQQMSAQMMQMQEKMQQQQQQQQSTNTTNTTNALVSN